MRQEAAAVATQLEGKKLTIGAKASSTGKIFGSVNNIQIAEALEKDGFIIERKNIVIKDTVKELGSYTATVKLHRDVKVSIDFEVVRSEEHTSELQSRPHLVCRLLLEKK